MATIASVTIRMVCPSGTARAAACAAIMPLAPVLFSMTTDTLRFSPSCLPMIRASASACPPAE